MEIIFGTDGWRGLLNKEINDQSVETVAQAFADYMIQKNESSAAVGFDGRKNSLKYAEIFSSVLSGNNIEVVLSENIIPTPVLSYYVKEQKLDAGVMITASHNPAEYNGVKFKAAYGGPFFTEETLKVEEQIGKSKIKRDHKLIERKNFLNVYSENILKLVDFESIKKSGMNVLVDSMGGAGQKIIEEQLKKFDIKCTTIFSNALADFDGRQAEPIEKNLLQLSQQLKEKGNYSLGVATDGDADRLGVMLENGAWLSAQLTILLLSDFIVNEKKIKGDIVKTSSVTDKVKQFLQGEGRKVYDVQVGFKYICESMIKHDISFGCEESGGYGYKGHIPERDGILSAFFVMEMLAKSGCSKISQLVEKKREEFGHIFYDRIDYKYEKPDRLVKLQNIYKNPPQNIARKNVESLYKFFSSRNTINGLKFILEGETRWLLLRASETEPLIRIYAEGESFSEVKEILEYGIQMLDLK